ncbi:MAG: DNA repair protein RadC [Anaerolineales bacterium]|nr:DNA repair protein RadC [Anaerolineales bacterium]
MADTYTRSQIRRRYVRDMPVSERPLTRLQENGTAALSTAEVLASIVQTHDALDLATDMLNQFGSLAALSRATISELCLFDGVGESQAGRIKAALELGRRMVSEPQDERPRVASPADAANLVMSEMMHLEQEHLRLILLDTRNRVLGTPTIYVGSLNTSVVRVGELFRAAIRSNAAAVIVLHNHPSGDPSPSPEDVNVTRQLVQAGKLVDIEVLDHVVIGYQRYASLKERALGFD